MRILVRSALLSAIVMLAACSGGSGGGGGGGTGSTPNPPAPGPSPTNTSLTGALVSENFTNDASHASARFNGVTVLETAAESETLTFRYDASSGSYTVSQGSRSQTFRSQDRTAITGQLSIYQRTSGNTTDTLSITRPGNSDTRYTYVGGGFWERAVQGSNSVTGSIDAFTYGVETPDAALPRSGSAGFDVTLLGIVATPGENEAIAASGTGSLIVDFASGHIDTNGNMIFTRPSTGSIFSSGYWNGSGTVSSNANLFGGTMTVLGFGRLDGGFKGRFYGPGSEEVGAAFWGRNNSDGSVISGTLLGRLDPDAVTLNRLAELDSDTQFIVPGSAVSYELDAAGNIVASGADRHFQSFEGSTAQIDFTAATNSYAVKNQSAGSWDNPSPNYIELSFDDSDRLATQSDARFTSYRQTLSDGSVADIRLYKPDDTNPELALSYTSFIEINLTTPPEANGNITHRESYVPFGLRTPQDQVPHVGTATYSGVVYGTGLTYRPDQSGPNTLYTLSGTSLLTIDFAAVINSLQLSITGVDTGGNNTDFGTFAFNIQNSNGELNGSGDQRTFSGFLFGPAAEEFGGTFKIRDIDGDVWGELTGVTVGKQN
ncbi:transferrin-binding protein-like solute binding protein [Sphingosinithalassobacter portus]|uniref:transferrin-binding protein-like solute binding protein n=1 Tax=Stakelama portus TaxID=2676234 RepID=UPI0011AB5984|nr:transferrin-binding protein-like solute binding protein [Sphingosinithalassobacter portus]